MARILITAFEPYDHWPENASWLALVEFTKGLPPSNDVTTRLYPVDFEVVRRHLERDLDGDYDFALHLGQAPGAAHLRLEAIGLNVGGNAQEPGEYYPPLVPDGPVAYRSKMPLRELVRELRSRNLPASISYHAGTYLCNATLYLTHYLAEKRGLRTQATFLHLPLDTCQAVQQTKEVASLPAGCAATAVHAIIQSLAKRSRLPDPKPA